MHQWYIGKMKQAATFKEASNYAQMAGLTIQDLMRIRYLEE